MSKLISDQDDTFRGHSVIFKGVTIATLTEVLIAKYSSVTVFADQLAYIMPKVLELNHGAFINQHTTLVFPDVIVTQQADQLSLYCDCYAERDRLCDHQAIVLTAILKRNEFRAFYDDKLRHEKLKKFAADYGMEQEPDLDSYFQLAIENKKLVISPKNPALMPVSKASMDALKGIFVPEIPQPSATDENPVFVVLKQHKYYKYLYLELYSAQTTKDGKVKNPLTQIAPLDLIWQTEEHEQLKFYTGIHKFQNHLNNKLLQADIDALKAVVKNPLGYDFYTHNSEAAEKVTAGSVTPVKVKLLPDTLKLNVNPKDQFFELSGTITIDKQVLQLKDLSVRFTYFIEAGEALYLASNLQVLNVVNLLSKKQDNLLIHDSKFAEFKSQLLAKLEDSVGVNYKYIPPATPVQLKKQGFNQETERIIYLSDFGQHVMIIPVMRYGEVEISVRTKRQIYSVDDKGQEFMVKRDDASEVDFTALLIKQHPYFEEQLEENDLHYFYLHKKRFLDEEWFLNVFEEWQNQKITILGFNELEGNKLNPNKVKITIQVLSGINWFNTLVDARFGKKRAALKQIYRAVKNKTKYVQLDDGTTGILPADWLEKFTNYFNSGEIGDDYTIRTPKVNFTVIEQLYDAAMLDERVKDEISIYHKKLDNFESIKLLEPSADLKGTLRPYQQQGLSWLNFLDDFNFGGCLADDMGLGKSIQIIAFILSQREKVNHNTNIIVVPTSLIFNWQQEIAKFAPSIRVRTIYGADRIKSIEDFDHYEVILTSYGTLLADINFLKDYIFNYVFLDESQQIKNPNSQRYKTARLLKARNRVAITGTPIENNTFDLYGQLSFACPGLLGSKQYFKDIYSVPIDKFKSSKRALELQKKIGPFVLRRTKQEVAAELPEKTEMVLYCEMQPAQRNIYDAYEKEFRDFISATNGDELKKTSMNVLKGITKLRQICDSPLLIQGEKMPGNESAKIEMLMEQIESKRPQHKILVFSQFVTMLDLIKAELQKRDIGFSYLTGQTRGRQTTIEQFQNNPDIRVFLISLKAGGTGLNLTEADYVYLVDPWWNPAVENQAIDRCHRIGQNKKIVAVRLICPGTVEEKMMIMQEDKRHLANHLIQTDQGVLNSLSKDDLLGLLS